MADLTVPGLLVTACAALAATIKILDSRREKDKERHEAEVRELRAENKELWNKLENNARLFSQALAKTRLASSLDSEPPSQMTTGRTTRQ